MNPRSYALKEFIVRHASLEDQTEAASIFGVVQCGAHQTVPLLELQRRRLWRFCGASGTSERRLVECYQLQSEPR
jgi:hypothetical protein